MALVSDDEESMESWTDTIYRMLPEEDPDALAVFEFLDYNGYQLGRTRSQKSSFILTLRVGHERKLQEFILWMLDPREGPSYLPAHFDNSDRRWVPYGVRKSFIYSPGDGLTKFTNRTKAILQMMFQKINAFERGGRGVNENPEFYREIRTVNRIFTMRNLENARAIPRPSVRACVAWLYHQANSRRDISTSFTVGFPSQEHKPRNVVSLIKDPQAL